MARNKYPEETVQKILDNALSLFVKKGFEKTSIQDIVNMLGMSKGAIYHHFKSKEEILERLCKQIYSNINWFYEIKRNPNMNGLQKVRQAFQHEIGNEKKAMLDAASHEAVGHDARMVMEHLKSAVDEAGPLMVQLLEEGIQDGSIHTDQPREAAEVILILMNLWVNPLIFQVDKGRFLCRVRFYGKLLDGVGIPLVDQEFERIAGDYYDTVVGAHT